ncbi:MAG: hypothetical protein SF052_09980 [Bacteroidia bacterium]|nr:hypothetical protein [Bacteroidia bacterium]
MEAFLIRLKDRKYRNFLTELLSRLDFIEWTPATDSAPAAETSHDLFASAGMWADYEIDAQTLRKSAWKKS